MFIKSKGSWKVSRQNFSIGKIQSFSRLKDTNLPHFFVPSLSKSFDFQREKSENVIHPVIKLYDGKLTGFHDPLTPDEFSNSVNQKCLLLAVQAVSQGRKNFFILIPSKQSQSSKLSALEKWLPEKCSKQKVICSNFWNIASTSKQQEANEF